MKKSYKFGQSNQSQGVINIFRKCEYLTKAKVIMLLRMNARNNPKIELKLIFIRKLDPMQTSTSALDIYAGDP